MKNHQLNISARLLLFCFISIFAFSSVGAQKFGKIDVDRIKEESHPLDPEASHAYIVKNCYVHYDLKSRFPRLISEYHYRIKIYSDDAIDQANIVKYIYRNKKRRETIHGIKAECHNFVFGKVEKVKLSKKGIFKEEVDEYTTKVSFAIPNARAGSVIEFKYRINSPFLYSLPIHYFQEDIPVDFSQLTVDVPDYFVMAPIATGLVSLNRTQDKRIANGASVTQYIFNATDIPGIEDDKYVLDIKDYRSSLKYELSIIDFPNQVPQYFTKDWNSICENLEKEKLFGGAIDKKVKEAEGLISEIKSLDDKDKLDKIVDFINTNITWNGDLGKYGTNKYKQLFEAKNGDVADINLLLINLCRKSGLRAYPVLTKYRFHGILNTTYPSLTEINYVFALVEIEGEPISVDATSPYFEPGTLPLRALNIEGVLLKDKKPQIISLRNTNQNHNRFAGKYSINLEENRLEGKGKFTMKGYAATKERKKKIEENDDEDQQDLIKEIDNEGDEENEEGIDDDREDIYVYSNVKGLENKYGKITSSFDAQLYSPIQRIGNEIYVDAFVTLEFDENPFLNEMRKFPAFFNSKHYINHVAILEIPEGYKLKSKPEDVSFKMINGKGLFSYAVNESPGNVTINTVFNVNNDIFLPEEYSSLYDFFNQTILKQKEKIVFVAEQ